MRSVILAGVMSLTVLATPVRAAPDPYAIAPAPDEVDQLANRFMAALKAGKPGDAVDIVIASSPLWAERTGTREVMLGQADAATKAYGRVVKYEKVAGANIGSLVVRQFYLVQHEKMVTRWELDFARTPGGWSIAYFGFTDQIQKWFEGSQ